MNDLPLRSCQGGKIKAADGTDIAALIAGAAHNSGGKAALTHADGTLMLKGALRDDLSADWFLPVA